MTGWLVSGLPSLALMPIVHLTPAMEDRAFDVQTLALI